MNRREFLRRSAAGAAGVALAGCDSRLLNLLNSGEEQLWGMNVHPIADPIRGGQIDALRRLGIRRIRITLGLHRDLAGSYLRSYPAEYLGLLNDFDDSYPDPGAWPNLVRQAVLRSPGVNFFEVLNEPVKIPPGDYVERYLKPAYETIKAINPALQVVAGAPTGTSGGRMYFLQMTDAGADRLCDYRGAHFYTDNPEILLMGTRRPFMVTESGAEDPGRHVEWWARKMTHISGVLDTDRLYWYVLADQTDSSWAIISARSRAGRIESISPLYDYIRVKWGQAG